MELDNILEKVDYLNNRKEELDQALDEMGEVLTVGLNRRSTINEYDQLQQMLNKAVEIRRVVNSLSAKVPDVQEDLRNMITELEDKASLEA